MRRAVPPELDASQRSPPVMNAILSLYVSGKRSKRPSCASWAEAEKTHAQAHEMITKTKKFRMEIMRAPVGDSCAEGVSQTNAIGTTGDCNSVRRCLLQIVSVTPNL